MIVNKISVPSVVKVRKVDLFEPVMIDFPIMLKISAFDYLYHFSKECVNDEVDEIDIIFTSDIDDITFFHYKDQPKTLLCRKLLRKFIGEDFGGFD